MTKTSTENLHRHKDSKKLWTTYTEGHAHDVTIPPPPDLTPYALKTDLDAAVAELQAELAALTLRVVALENAQKYQGAIPP